MISAIGLDRGLHMDFGSYAGYGIPYKVVGRLRRRVHGHLRVRRRVRPRRLPDPSLAAHRGWLGRHILMVDEDACRLYELFAAAKDGSAWTAGSGATWDLRSNALRPDGWTSADAAGLPILPGLVRYDEVAAGAIAHALRFTTNQTRQGVHLPRTPLRQLFDVDLAATDGPARPTQGDVRHVGLLTAGAGHRRRAQALRHDPGRQRLALVHQRHERSPFDDDVLHELDVITGRDLEVVDTRGWSTGRSLAQPVSCRTIGRP